MRDGIIVIDKPEGITSHDVVDRARKALKIRRVGHAGTLDPMATGVLIILVGNATKLFKQFLKYDKEYKTTLTLGKATDTGDAQGRVINTSPIPDFKEDLVKSIFKGFTGEIQQVPPMVSALRYKGKRLYQLARKGIEVPRQARRVMVRQLELLRCQVPDIEFSIVCSTGFYIRQLGQDISLSLGCSGHISKICRERVGPFTLKEAISVDKIDESHIRPWKD